MPIIVEKDDPDLFRLVTDANLLRQYDYLRQCVAIALKNPKTPISHRVIKDLNHHAVVNLCQHPGEYRACPISITNTPHVPPDHPKVNGLMDDFMHYLGEHWADRSELHLSAYVLWRLNWIHPFEEGNGRTARATSYHVLCVKYGMWLPGANTIPMQIRVNRTPYYAALRAADIAYDKGEIDVSALEDYLEELLRKQLGEA